MRGSPAGMLGHEEGERGQKGRKTSEVGRAGVREGT